MVRGFSTLAVTFHGLSTGGAAVEKMAGDGSGELWRWRAWPGRTNEPKPKPKPHPAPPPKEREWRLSVYSFSVG
eukprot:6249695-Amphidinium_carterae.1